MTRNQIHMARLAADDVSRAADGLLHYLRMEPETRFREVPGFYEDVAKLENAALTMRYLANLAEAR